MTAKDCMTSPVIAVTEETSVDDCCRVMEENQVRRVPVVDAKGKCCGMVAQADVARNATGQQTAGMVKEVSQAASKVSNTSGSGRL
jgi:CBS domain-containing protein